MNLTMDKTTTTTTSINLINVVDNKGIKLVNQECIQTKLDEEWELGDLFRVGDPSVGGWPF